MELLKEHLGQSPQRSHTRAEGPAGTGQRGQAAIGHPPRFCAPRTVADGVEGVRVLLGATCEQPLASESRALMDLGHVEGG